ncbi:hypothetical protein FACS189476_08650 [Spirochaetia bacterium]|nr:hypothetical protein FACS189476_08650 [Spirochaetia bacterium]
MLFLSFSFIVQGTLIYRQHKYLIASKNIRQDDPELLSDFSENILVIIDYGGLNKYLLEVSALFINGGD